MVTPIDSRPRHSKFGALKSQLAVVRALVDEAEHPSRAMPPGMNDQLVEELGRLGCRLIELAASMGEPTFEEQSGVRVISPR